MESERFCQSDLTTTGTGGETLLAQDYVRMLIRPNTTWSVCDVADYDPMSSFSITSEREEMLTELNEIGIYIPDPKSIRRYLTSNPDVIRFISRVSMYVWTWFGARSQLSLELYSDCETDDQYPTLYVRQDIYDENIIDMIDQTFDPFMVELAELNGWFLVTTDFRRPVGEI